MRRYMGRCGRGLEQIRGVFLVAVMAVWGLACSRAQVRPSASVPRRATDHRPASTPPPAPPAFAGPPELVAYCVSLGERRAALHRDLKWEVRAASLLPRAGYEPRTLAADEQSAASGQAQIFLGRESVVTEVDLAAVRIEPSWRSDSGGYDVMVRVKSASALAPHLQPLVGGLVAVIANGHLISLPHLKWPEVWVWPVATGLALPEARIIAARLSPPEDTAGLQRLEERCLTDEPTLCVPLAEELLSGWDAPHDPERATALVEAGCQLGIGAACRRAAEFATDPPHAAELLESGCRWNDSEACLLTATRVLGRHAAADDRARGRAMLTRLCDQGFGRACMPLAEALAADFPDPAPPTHEAQEKFVGLLERGCTGGDAEACFTASNAARRGLVDPPDTVAAKRWLRAGCALDPSGGSMEIAVKFGGADPAQLRAMSEAGCTGEPALRAQPAALCTPTTKH